MAPGHPSKDYPFFATDKDIGSKGYVEEEFFFDGLAKQYNTPAGQTGQVISQDHSYRTRMVVRRPKLDANFNGVVIVEWYNVTAGSDGEIDWFALHEHLIEKGYAWVGVSAQRVGVDALKGWSSRYSSLDVTRNGTITNDALSYDIFSQAGQAIRTPGGVDPLGGLRKARTVIAMGESQSAIRLTTYINSVMSRGDKAYDAVILHSGLGGRVRDDSPTKTFIVNAEWDVAAIPGSNVQADSNATRVWEVTGTAHLDYDMQLAGKVCSCATKAQAKQEARSATFPTSRARRSNMSLPKRSITRSIG